MVIDSQSSSHGERAEPLTLKHAEWSMAILVLEVTRLGKQEKFAISDMGQGQ